MPLMYRMLLIGYMLGFARALGEFDATLMLAGNIPGRTQTIATVIYIAADSGKTWLTFNWVIVMIVISMLLLLVVRQPAKNIIDTLEGNGCHCFMSPSFAIL